MITKLETKNVTDAQGQNCAAIEQNVVCTEVLNLRCTFVVHNMMKYASVRKSLRNFHNGASRLLAVVEKASADVPRSHSFKSSWSTDVAAITVEAPTCSPRISTTVRCGYGAGEG